MSSSCRDVVLCLRATLDLLFAHTDPHPGHFFLPSLTSIITITFARPIDPVLEPLRRIFQQMILLTNDHHRQLLDLPALLHRARYMHEVLHFVCSLSSQFGADCYYHIGDISNIVAHKLFSVDCHRDAHSWLERWASGDDANLTLHHAGVLARTHYITACHDFRLACHAHMTTRLQLMDMFFAMIVCVEDHQTLHIFPHEGSLLHDFLMQGSHFY
jgi:hypothetical protein